MQPVPPPPTGFPWPRPAQGALVLFLAIAGGLLGIQAYSQSRLAARPTEPAAGLAYRIDLNRATHAELLQLPGLGENLVRRIEDYRRDHGPFRDVEQLREVAGIGPSRVEQVRPWITATATDEPPRPAAAKRRRPGAKKESSLTVPVDLNNATPAELERLPGVGPATAGLIVAERAKGPFRSPDDLVGRVPGIGARKLERLKPFITVKDPRATTQGRR